MPEDSKEPQALEDRGAMWRETLDAERYRFDVLRWERQLRRERRQDLGAWARHCWVGLVAALASMGLGSLIAKIILLVTGPPPIEPIGAAELHQTIVALLVIHGAIGAAAATYSWWLQRCRIVAKQAPLRSIIHGDEREDENRDGHQ